MREIKFRGMRVDTGEWECGFYIEERAGNDVLGFVRKHVIYNNGGLNRVEVDHATVGEFTGLKDKNGVDIYEGDKLRVPALDQFEKHNFNSFEIFWHDNDCSPTDVGLVIGRMETHGNSGGGYCGHKLVPEHVGRMEVIGNIHNPELLEVAK